MHIDNFIANLNRTFIRIRGRVLEYKNFRLWFRLCQVASDKKLRVLISNKSHQFNHLFHRSKTFRWYDVMFCSSLYFSVYLLVLLYFLHWLTHKLSTNSTQEVIYAIYFNLDLANISYATLFGNMSGFKKLPKIVIKEYGRIPYIHIFVCFSWHYFAA